MGEHKRRGRTTAAVMAITVSTIIKLASLLELTGGQTKESELQGLSSESESPTLKAAQRAVIDTTELLEIILSHLDIPSLFAFRRVSRRWQKILTTNKMLQTRMFLL